MFESLNVDELNDIDDLVQVAKDDMAAKQKSNTPVNVFEFEEDEKANIPFITFCFFEDLADLRGFILETWEKVVNNEIDHTTASLVTNVASGLAREAERRLLDAYSQHLCVKAGSYIAMTSFIKPDLHGSRPSTSLFHDEFVFGDIFYIMAKQLVGLQTYEGKF